VRRYRRTVLGTMITDKDGGWVRFEEVEREETLDSYAHSIIYYKGVLEMYSQIIKNQRQTIKMLEAKNDDGEGWERE